MNSTNWSTTLTATRRGATTTNVAYTYDDRDRPMEACYGVTTGSGASDYLADGYDKSSNLTSEDRVGSVPNPASWTPSYNSADQLTSRTDGTTTITYTYDDNWRKVFDCSRTSGGIGVRWMIPTNSIRCERGEYRQLSCNTPW